MWPFKKKIESLEDPEIEDQDQDVEMEDEVEANDSPETIVPLVHLDLLVDEETGKQKISVQVARGVTENPIIMAEAVKVLEPLVQKIRLAQRERVRELKSLQLSRKDNTMSDENTGVAGEAGSADAGEQKPADTAAAAE